MVKIVSFANPRAGTADNPPRFIFLDATLDVGRTVLFSASPRDIMQYGVDAYNDALAGKFGVIAPYDPNFDAFGVKARMKKTIPKKE